MTAPSGPRTGALVPLGSGVYRRWTQVKYAPGTFLSDESESSFSGWTISRQGSGALHAPSTNCGTIYVAAKPVRGH